MSWIARSESVSKSASLARTPAFAKDRSMPTQVELPPDAETILATLAGDGMLWLSQVPNKGPRREPIYALFPDIRKTGVYVVRDAVRQPGLFYVGKVVQDPQTDTINPNADGIIGRLSGHQNMSGSNVLARWFQHIHPEVPIPTKLRAGSLRDRVRTEAADRLEVAYAACAPHAANRIESYVIKRGLPGDGVPPILNSPNWRSPISKMDGDAMGSDELDAIEQRADPYTGPGRDVVRLLGEVRRLRSLGDGNRR